MTDTKTYSSKSNAVRAFRQQHPNHAGPSVTSAQIVDLGYVDEDEPGRWVLNDPALIEARDAEEAAQAKADAEYAAREQARRGEAERRAQADRDAEANHPMVAGKSAATGGKVLNPAQPRPARAPSGSSNGLKIEANRETRNGQTRPSIGGKCRGIWDALDEMGTAATAKQARDALLPRGFDKTTVMVQFYRWRKFNGVEGRQA